MEAVVVAEGGKEAAEVRVVMFSSLVVLIHLACGRLQQGDPLHLYHIRKKKFFLT